MSPSRPGASSGLFRTTDGGSSWRSVGSFGRLTALSFSTNGRVIVGGGGGKVFTSDDDGGTWIQSSGVPSGGAVTALASSGATVLAGTSEGRVFRSTNLGSAFSEVGGAALPDEQITSIAMSDALLHGSLGVGVDVEPWVCTGRPIEV